jgi:hypothetical protein
MRAGESFTGAPVNEVTSTSAGFVLDGGKYWFAAVGTFNGGTVALQKLGPDGQTFVNAGATASVAFTTNGNGVVDLPPGQYQVTVTGSTTAAVWWEVIRINEE